MNTKRGYTISRGVYKNDASRKASEWNKLHPDRAKINRDTWAKNNPERNHELKKAYYWKYRDRIRKRCNAEYSTKGRDQLLRWAYGITLQDYNRMFQIQGGMCEICKRHQSNFKASLHVDHDHKTDKVRGLLCAPCNNGLAPLENTEWRKKAEIYLKKYGS